MVPERPRDWGRETAPSPDGVCSAFSPAALELGAWQGWGQGLAGLHGHPGAMPAAPLMEQEEQTGTGATAERRVLGSGTGLFVEHQNGANTPCSLQRQ